MIKEGVRPTSARRLNYSERSGKVVDTLSQGNANHESVARVTTGPPVAETDVVFTPPRGNAIRESTVGVAQAHQLPLLTSLLILITFSWKP